MNHDSPAQDRRWRPFIPPRLRAEAGMTLVEISIGVALIALIATAAIVALVLLNKNAVSTRIMTNGREIVQRNIEAAVGTPFTSSTNPPAILQFTNNTAWDDAGGSSPVKIYTSRDGTANVTGDLRRTVTAEPNGAGADIRRVSFRLNYPMYGRQLSYEMTTIRAMDK